MQGLGHSVLCLIACNHCLRQFSRSQEVKSNSISTSQVTGRGFHIHYHLSGWSPLCISQIVSAWRNCLQQVMYSVSKVNASPIHLDLLRFSAPIRDLLIRLIIIALTDELVQKFTNHNLLIKGSKRCSDNQYPSSGLKSCFAPCLHLFISSVWWS